MKYFLLSYLDLLSQKLNESSIQSRSLPSSLFCIDYTYLKDDFMPASKRIYFSHWDFSSKDLLEFYKLGTYCSLKAVKRIESFVQLYSPQPFVDCVSVFGCEMFADYYADLYSDLKRTTFENCSKVLFVERYGRFFNLKFSISKCLPKDFVR